MKIKNIITLLILINSLNIISQENDFKSNVNFLDPVTIYGNMLNTDNIKTGKNITVIKAQEIENYNFNSIDDLLKIIPSIELQSRGGFGSQSDIVLRGSTFNQTLVLLDGMRVNDPLTGHFSMYIPITISDIHQIEIIRGGASSIYGPDAVGGVINIVTKTFTKVDKEKEIILSNKLGQNNLKNSHLFISHNIKNNKYDNNIYSTFSVNQIKSDGQEIYDEIYSFFDHNTVSISSRLDASDKLSMAIRTTYDKRYFNSQYYYTRSPYDLSNETVEKFWTQAKLNYNINNNQKVDFNFSYQSVDDVYVFNPAFPNYENQTNLVHGRLSYLINLNKSTFTFGSDWQQRKMTSLDRGNHEDNYIGGFVNFITSLNNFNINPSFRVDHNEHYGLQFCPQLDINYNNKIINIRASAGRAIRSADFTERFYNNNYNGTLSSGRNVGNPKLNAEKTLNYEIGIDYIKNKFVKINNTVFYRNSSDLIDWVLTPSQNIPININLIENETYFFAQNISELFTLGMESELWFHLLNKKNLKLFGSIGYLKILQAENSDELFNDNDSLIMSKYLANNSGDKFNYNITFQYKKLMLNFSGIYKARDKEVDLSIGQTLEEDYFVHNSKVSFLLSKNISTSIEIMNILNKNYSDFMGAIMPKRWLIFGLECKI